MLKSSSTFSSKIPKAVLLTICIIVVFELFIAVFFKQDASGYYAKVTDIEQHFKHIHCLFLGDSKIAHGIDIDYLRNVLHENDYNMGIDASTAVTQYLYLKRVIDSHVNIDQLVLGISKLHLIDVYNFRPREQYLCQTYSFAEYLQIFQDLPAIAHQYYWYSQFLPSYRYFVTPFNFIPKLKASHKTNISANYDYMPLETHFELNNALHNNTEGENRKLSTLNMLYTEKIIQLCLKYF